MLFAHSTPQSMLFGHSTPQSMLFAHNTPQSMLFGHSTPQSMLFGHSTYLSMSTRTTSSYLSPSTTAHSSYFSLKYIEQWVVSGQQNHKGPRPQELGYFLSGWEASGHDGRTKNIFSSKAFRNDANTRVKQKISNMKPWLGDFCWRAELRRWKIMRVRISGWRHFEMAASPFVMFFLTKMNSGALCVHAWILRSGPGISFSRGLTNLIIFLLTSFGPNWIWELYVSRPGFWDLGLESRFRDAFKNSPVSF